MNARSATDQGRKIKSKEHTHILSVMCKMIDAECKARAGLLLHVLISTSDGRVFIFLGMYREGYFKNKMCNKSKYYRGSSLELKSINFDYFSRLLGKDSLLVIL